LSVITLLKVKATVWVQVTQGLATSLS